MLYSTSRPSPAKMLNIIAVHWFVTLSAYSAEKWQVSDRLLSLIYSDYVSAVMDYVSAIMLLCHRVSRPAQLHFEFDKAHQSGIVVADSRLLHGMYNFQENDVQNLPGDVCSAKPMHDEEDTWDSSLKLLWHLESQACSPEPQKPTTPTNARQPLELSGGTPVRGAGSTSECAQLENAVRSKVAFHTANSPPGRVQQSGNRAQLAIERNLLKAVQLQARHSLQPLQQLYKVSDLPTRQGHRLLRLLLNCCSTDKHATRRRGLKVSQMAWVPLKRLSGTPAGLKKFCGSHQMRRWHRALRFGCCRP